MSQRLPLTGILRRGIFLAVAFFVLVGAGVAVAGQASGLWSSVGRPAVREAAAIDEMMTKITADPTRTRDPRRRDPDGVQTDAATMVAQARAVNLVVLPTEMGGYCVGPSTATEPYLGLVCTDGSTGVAPSEEDLIFSWAVEPDTWVFLGRITDSAVREISVGGVNISLTDEGFFIGSVPSARWAQLASTVAPYEARDERGRSRASGCVMLGPAPEGLTAAAAAAGVAFSGAIVPCQR